MGRFRDREISRVCLLNFSFNTLSGRITRADAGNKSKNKS